MSWDDGKHIKVNKVQLTYDDVIRSIEVEYEGTNLKSQRRGTVGTKSDGFTLDTDEYITNVSGYYKTTISGDLITALTFKTNKKTYGPYGNKTQHYFSADAPRDSQIAGFLGTSGSGLSSLDVHFAPIPPPGSIKPKPVGPGTGGGGGSGTGSGQGSSEPDGLGKMGPLGGDKGNVFNDVGFEGVKKITVGADEYSVTYIMIEYIKDGNVVVREHGTIRGKLKEFSVDYPKENIVSVGGTYKHVFTYDTTLITSLYFTTSKGTTSPLFGEQKGTDFEFKGENGGKLLGFHGRGGNAIDAIGAYFDTSSRKGEGGYEKKGPLGGDKGNEFNDVGFEGVKKVTVGADEYSVTYIKIEYVKDGKVEIREHGTSRGKLQEFSVDYPKENIVAVGGTYKHVFTYDTTLITSLYFTTSKGTTSPLFGEMKGTNFEFKGEKLIGFHGRGGNAIDAIGAYFATSSQGGDGGKPSTDGPKPKHDVPGKKGPLGGDKGNEFDDVGFEGVKKITVGADEYSVTYIKIEYVKDGKVEVREHGTSRGKLQEFSVDYPKENIVAVGGTYKHIFTYDTTLITSLYFTTSKGTTSPLFGEMKGTNFEFKGDKLIGFHGRGGNAIDAIGAYFATSSQGGDGGNISTDSPKPKHDVPGKKGPLGGDNGNEFDDLGFEGVKKITVGADEYSVTYIKIEYVNNGKVEIREHGTSRGKLQEFSVDYPKENIVAVGGTYKHIFTYDTTLITSLYFTTSKGTTSPLFGEQKGTDFEFKGENGGKLIGFHGRGGNAIDAIGAYFDTGSQGGDSSKGGDPGKKGPLGGDKGEEFNDVGFEGVKKVTVGADDFSITYIKIEYVKDGKVEVREHGTARGKLQEFSVNYPNDGITEVGGSYKHVFNYDTTLITSLYFTTSKGFTSPFFGKKYEKETTFEFKNENGGKLIGFHGRGGYAIDAIGAYFDTGSKLSSTQKLEAQGGKGGNQWDDGSDHDGVTKIHVTVGRVIEQIRFDYVKNGQIKEGTAHGVKGARSSISTFEISHPNEYLISVKGWSDSSNKIVGIQFITNTKTSEYFGFEKYPGEEGTEITLEVKDKKIVGFHGFADTQLNSLGAYFAPITA